LEATSQKNYDDWTQGGEKIKSAIARAAETTEVIEKDWLGVEQSAADAARHFQDAQDKSAAIRDNSAETAKNFGEGSAAIRSALEDIRGFDLKGEMGPDARPNWMRSQEPPPKSNPPASSESRGTTTRDVIQPDRPMTADQRVAQMRATAAGARTIGRAGEFQAGGMFRSSVRREMASERAQARVMDNQATRDLASQFDFAGREAGNLGEAMKSVIDEIGKGDFLGRLRESEGFDRGKSEMENFENALKKGEFDRERDFDPDNDMKRFADDAAKAEAERKREEESMKQKSKPPAGGQDKTDSAQQIYQWLQNTFFGEFKNRLPQVALG
jgi:hypothetical protein